MPYLVRTIENSTLEATLNNLEKDDYYLTHISTERGVSLIVLKQLEQKTKKKSD